MQKTYKIIAVSVFLFFSHSLFALSDLHIRSGQVFRVDSQTAKLDLVSFTIDNQAVIEIDPAVGSWVVSAKKAFIGTGIVIRGAGKSGRNGAAGVSRTEASACVNGASGGDGLPGLNGQSGVSIVWSLGVERFGNVNVDLSGGRGGDGGSGGDGQNIPNIAGCQAAAGNAGDGGNAGAGGSGGSFTLHYWLLEGADDVAGNSIAVKFNAGKPGKPGAAGFPGVAAPGRTADGRWIPGGKDGASGRNGANAVSGTTGALEIRKVADESGSPVVVEVDVPEVEPISVTAEERIKNLEIIVQKLEARIRLLELDKQ